MNIINLTVVSSTSLILAIKNYEPGKIYPISEKRGKYKNVVFVSSGSLKLLCKLQKCLWYPSNNLNLSILTREIH
jgi:hypothetical protein